MRDRSVIDLSALADHRVADEIGPLVPIAGATA